MYIDAHVDALSPPFDQTQNLQTVMDALQTAKANDVAATVKSLSVDEIDVLMKYLYRGMAAPEKFNAGALLQWHEKAVEAGGLGTIVRVLTDRKTV